MRASWKPVVESESLARREREAVRSALDMAKKQSANAVTTLTALMVDESVPPRDRIRAAEIVLSYGLGKPVQQTVSIEMQLTNEENQREAILLARRIFVEGERLVSGTCDRLSGCEEVVLDVD